MKKILGVFLVLILSAIIFIPQTRSKVKPYYSGDAIAYAGQVVIGTVDAGSLELYTIENGSFRMISDITTMNTRFNIMKDFGDIQFNIEAGRLYVYAVSEYELYKYDISGLDSASLVRKRSNTLWEWYNGIEKMGNDLVTISSKGVKVIDTDTLDTINTYNLSHANHKNLNSNDGRYIFSVQQSKIEVFDRESRQIVKTWPVNYKSADGAHKVYADSSTYYVVDDYSLRKYDFDGKLLASFRHLDQPGYDVVASSDGKYVYFSNGVGVVKSDKNTLAAVDWQFTTGLAEKEGWAMGLELVRDAQGDKLVIFNNSNILVLDNSLNKVASLKAVKEDSDPYPREALSLKLDRNEINAGSTVNLYGAGYLPGEKVQISYMNATFLANTDSLGRFTFKLVLPGDSPATLEVDTLGLNSGLSYSIAFQVNAQ